MSALAALILIPLAVLIWFHGFRQGREDMRSQVVHSLRLSADLHSYFRASDRSRHAAHVLIEHANRLERGGRKRDETTSTEGNTHA